jgi:ElaB/YqjD/DUF883 family membrane-anchored ribosome-binding protein
MESKTHHRTPETNVDRMTGDVDDIKSSFVQLRSDVVELFNNAFGLGKHGVGAAKDGAADAMEVLKERLDELKGKGVKKFESVERSIEDNPLPAALIAFGVGFVIAKLFSRR